MTNCANCGLEAKYQYDVSPSYAILYCFKHVPKFLAAQVAQGSLKIKEPEPIAPKSSKKKVVEEPVVDEPVVEDEVVEEDATN